MHWNGDHLIVADTGKNWVQRILTDTTNVAATGDPIGLDFELSMPLDVTSDRAKDFIFVADTGSDRVLKFLTTGAFEDSVSTRFDDDARLGGVPVLAPRYIAAEGSVVFVSDTENDRIVRFRLASPAVGGATE
jgi:DNA-binding beta-propeller fold protein YncE